MSDLHDAINATLITLLTADLAFHTNHIQRVIWIGLACVWALIAIRDWTTTTQANP